MEKVLMRYNTETRVNPEKRSGDPDLLENKLHAAFESRVYETMIRKASNPRVDIIF